jgi:bile acid-coenzyme A ligase
VDRWLELIDPKAFVFSYGSSERIGLAMMTGVDWHRKRGATGTPVACTMTIRDENGVILPPGEVGGIYLRPDPGQRVFRYIGVPTPEPTADGAYTLGDMGWLDDEGYLYVVDRRTDMIITGGANVFPAEVETALSEHPGLVDQVVVAVADEEWGHRVHAIVQPRDLADPPSVEELRAFCKERLAAYKVPKTIEIVQRVPRTEAGKLNRRTIGDERSSSSGGR